MATGDRRRYGPAELTRLQQVQFLQQAGFALADIPAVIASREPADLFAEQLDRARRDALVLRARTTIAEAVVRVLDAQPDAVLPVRLLTALMDHEATLLRYPEVEFAGRPTSRLGELCDENELLGVYLAGRRSASRHCCCRPTAGRPAPTSGSTSAGGRRRARLHRCPGPALAAGRPGAQDRNGRIRGLMSARVRGPRRPSGS